MVMMVMVVVVGLLQMVTKLMVVVMRYAARRCWALWTGTSTLCTTRVATDIPADIPTRVPAVGVFFRFGVGWEVDPGKQPAEKVVVDRIHVPLRVKGHAWGSEGGQVRGQLVCRVFVEVLAFLGIVLVLKGQNLHVDLVLDPETLQTIGAQDRKPEEMGHLHQAIVR